MVLGEDVGTKGELKSRAAGACWKGVQTSLAKARPGNE